MFDRSKIFNYESLAQEYDIDENELIKLIQDAKEEFPNDDMMFELHVIRLIKSLQREKIN